MRKETAGRAFLESGETSNRDLRDSLQKRLNLLGLCMKQFIPGAFLKTIEQSTSI